jgi:hypothetical protein
MDEVGNDEYINFRVREKYGRMEMCDHLAEAMFEIIFSASSVTESPDRCWAIHHNTVWSEFFPSNKKGVATRVILFKLRRLLWEEIRELEKIPNYKSSRILEICLNVLGVKLGNKDLYHGEYQLHKVVLTWVKRNYLSLRKTHPEVAESCLMGSISFDKENSRLVRTYFKGLKLEPPKDYLDLC